MHSDKLAHLLAARARACDLRHPDRNKGGLRRRHHHLFGEELGAAFPLLGSGRRRFGPFQAGQVLVDSYSS